jgi:hypothetical protein
MKKIFALFIMMACTGAFAVSPDSEIGREFVDSAMEECVDSMVEDGAGLGMASDYCNCVLLKVVSELSVEQITEYYKHGRTIEQLMELSAKECVGILLDSPDSDTKEQIISAITEQCVESAMESGAGLGIASEYCKCAANKMFENLSIEQITEYYNHGREIEDQLKVLTKECVELLGK